DAKVGVAEAAAAIGLGNVQGGEPQLLIELLPALAVEARLGRHQAAHLFGGRSRLQRPAQGGAEFLLLRRKAEAHNRSSQPSARGIFPDMTATTRPSPMALALGEARLAAERGEVPIGAVVVGPDGAVLAASGNRTEAERDPTAHAELLAIRAAAAKLGAPRL